MFDRKLEDDNYVLVLFNLATSPDSAAAIADITSFLSRRRKKYVYISTILLISNDLQNFRSQRTHAPTHYGVSAINSAVEF